MAEWAQRIGISVQTLSNRVNTYGWSEEKALTTPVKKQVKGRKLGFDRLYAEYMVAQKTIAMISSETGIPKSTLHREIKSLGLKRSDKT